MKFNMEKRVAWRLAGSAGYSIFYPDSIAAGGLVLLVNTSKFYPAI